jgi:integrase
MESKRQLLSGDVVGTVATATPRKRRRGKSMSRRRGQNGYLERSGNWWVVRFRMDVPGREERVNMRRKICPISGPGSLTESERKRKAKETIAASGADSAENFERAQAINNGTTFRDQAEAWLSHMRTRKREPVAPSTLKTWESCLEKWLNPNLGNLPLFAVDNEPVKALVSKMAASGLSPKSISNYFQVIRAVVASAKNPKTRAQLYPIVWDFEYLDMPVVKREEQHQPSFTSETVAGIVAGSKGKYRMLYTLCASTGLRIGEALGVDIARHISADCSVIKVQEKVWKGEIQGFLKTANGKREVELHSSVAAMLREFIGDRTSGLLFCSRNGKPLTHTNILRRSLHPLLAALGQPKAGAHAFRRFRATWLRKQRALEDLIRFWLGHSNRSITDEYSKVAEDVEFRKQVAEQVGIGFQLPASIAPKEPNCTEEVEVASAA